AIGWNEISLDPSKVSDAQLRVAHKETFESSDNGANRATVQFRNFGDLKRDDIVLICRGYNSTQKKDVHIHGVARVTGPFRAEARKKGWRFKHDAVIQEINMNFLRNVVASALQKQTLLQTIHALEKVNFDRLLKECGVQV